jgi:hypothetical protein
MFKQTVLVIHISKRTKLKMHLNEAFKQTCKVCMFVSIMSQTNTNLTVSGHIVVLTMNVLRLKPISVKTTPTKGYIQKKQ